MDVPTLTAERARALFDYSVVSGKLYWRVRSSNRVRPGDIVGSPDKRGALTVSVDYRRYFVHRVVFLIVTGEWPENQIDHRNGRPYHNGFHNLRDVPGVINSQNQRGPHAGSASGYLGVTFDVVHGAWLAQIRVGGKRLGLGRFATPGEASAAYVAAKRKHHAGCTI